MVTTANHPCWVARTPGGKEKGGEGGREKEEVREGELG